MSALFNSPIPIVFAFDDKYRLPASTCLHSLLATKNQDSFYQIYVIYDERSLAPSTRESICTFLNKKFSGFSLEWLNFDPTALKLAPTLSWLSIETYFRLFIPELLPQHDKVIWADSDFIFKKDISTLYHIDLGDSDAAAPRDVKNDQSSLVCHAYYPEITREYIYTTCLIIFNARKWREDKLTEKCLQNIEKYKDQLQLLDLDIFNLTMREITPLPPEANLLLNFVLDPQHTKEPSSPFNESEVEHAKQNLYTLHYAGLGSSKPWACSEPFKGKFDDWIAHAKLTPFGKEWRKKSHIHTIKSFFRSSKRKQKIKSSIIRNIRDAHRDWREKSCQQWHPNLAENQFALRPKIILNLSNRSKSTFPYFTFRDLDMVNELNLFLKHTKNCTSLLDIGALHGVFSLAFTANETKAKALAIDPSPHSIETLHENITLNPHCNIHPLQIAAGDTQKPLPMAAENYGDAHHLVITKDPHAATSLIEQNTGDNICSEHNFTPDVIKIDVEGYELNCLHGLLETITSSQPKIFLEVHPSFLPEGQSLSDIWDFLAANQYQLLDLYETPLSQETFCAYTHITRILCHPSPN